MSDARLRVTAKPGSPRPGLTVTADLVMLRVRERAVGGAANDACIRALAQALGVAPSRITLIRGASSRQKTFAISGMDDDDVRIKLASKQPTR